MPLVLFYIALIMLQGALTALLAVTPDLFLVGVVALIWRLATWRMVIIAYLAGLLQDMIGNGTLGLHALGLAGGILLGTMVASQISPSGISNRLLVVLFALVGKWLVFWGLLIWISEPEPWATVIALAPREILLTLLCSIPILPWAQRLIAQNPLLRKQLL